MRSIEGSVSTLRVVLTLKNVAIALRNGMARKTATNPTGRNESSRRVVIAARLSTRLATSHDLVQCLVGSL